MGRPSKDVALLSRLFAAQHVLWLESLRRTGRPCPGLSHLHADRRPSCSDCVGQQCQKMYELGLAEDSTALPAKDRPFCSAKARSGKACLKKVVPGKKRCRFHGGLSTGPRSDAGKVRISLAQKKRWAQFRARKKES